MITEFRLASSSIKLSLLLEAYVGRLTFSLLIGGALRLRPSKPADLSLFLSLGGFACPIIPFSPSISLSFKMC